MNNENLYKDFIEAVKKDAEICKYLIADMRYSCDKIEHATEQIKDLLEMQRKNLTYLATRSSRLDELFNRICASNDR